jgi:lambda repressor-like predicted transcriptional regulator
MTTTTATPPEHGTTRRYRLGCHCQECRAAAARQAKTRVYAHHTGTWRDPYTDTARACEHLRTLTDAGLTLSEIARLSGVNHDTLRTITGRRRGIERRRITRVNEQRILAVRLDLDRLPPHALIPATATRRRLQALAVTGWSAAVLAERAGVQQQALTLLRSGRQPLVRAGTARAVRDLFERLACTDALGLVPDAAKAKLVKTLARRRGWAPAAAWDEDTIDDPAAEPDLGARTRRQDAIAEDAAWIARTEVADRDLIAARLGISRDYLDQALTRAAREPVRVLTGAAR